MSCAFDNESEKLNDIKIPIIAIMFAKTLAANNNGDTFLRAFSFLDL